MSTVAMVQAEPVSEPRFVRLAGAAGLLVVVVGFLLNGVLEGAGLAPNAPLADVIAYTADRAGRLRLSNGLRTAAVALLPVFATGVHTWIGAPGGSWRTVGMLGLALVPPLGIVANSGATIALWRLPQLSEQTELATMLWSTTVVLFNGLLVLYGVGVGAFSLAGRASGRMPRWLWILGVTFGAIGIATGAGINAVVTREWAAGIVYTAFGLLSVWVAATSVLLLRAGRSP